MQLSRMDGRGALGDSLRAATGETGIAAGSPVPRNFASLPDRGELAVYDAVRKPRISGAYSAYPVRLSEEHAFAATRAGGQLSIKAPNGETIKLAYERHVEHPDGNWTWIGRDASGSDAVITFGEKAAFGTIPMTGEEALRLVTSQGSSWMIATDRSKIADVDPARARGAKTDYVIPPKLAASIAIVRVTAVAAAGEKLAPRPANATATAASTTIDVVLGYTNGLAAALGGASQAVTRLNNLVEIANQGYTNSGINASLKLVATVSVAYGDDSDNGATLEKLSGFNSSGPITPDPAFAGLRAARDTYRADLVSLVRDFRTPQNNGCGIAWLIGGGGDPIVQADAPYGYSVVSDGTDVDEGDGQTYVCRDESLAHEMGHNMGQAHNQQDSTSAGAHPYSYGYRETTNDGFYTIMAYRLPNSIQTGIRHFANPAIQYAGRPTGVANTSDNALSMNQTMPIIATFRAGLNGASVDKDVDGDGKTDAIWYQPTSRIIAYWIMNGAAVGRTYGQSVPTGYSLVANGDYYGDGRVDVLLRGPTNQLHMWNGDGNVFGGPRIASDYPASWNILGSPDVDGDGRSDILWYQSSSRTLAYWIMSGSSVIRTYGQSVPAGYTVVANGDYYGDGRADVLLRGPTNQLHMWNGDGNVFGGPRIASDYPASWVILGSPDVDGDGKSDILWYQSSSRTLAYWIMNGASVVRTYGQSMPAGYTVVASGDYYGDGRADVLLKGPYGDLHMWNGNGSTFYGPHVSDYPASWVAVF